MALGDVQGVGYRRAVEKLARSFGVAGYIQNKLDGTVKILAEGETKNLGEFLRAIMIVEPPIKVEAIQRKEKRATGRYKRFAIRAGSIVQELQEGLGAGQEQLSLFRMEFKDYRDDFEDYRAEFRDYRAEFKDYRGEFKDFASRTDNNFRELGERRKVWGDIREADSSAGDTSEGISGDEKGDDPSHRQPFKACRPVHSATEGISTVLRVNPSNITFALRWERFGTS